MENLVKFYPNGQWEVLEKAQAKSTDHSMFAMDHVRDVTNQKDHGAAKAMAHSVVDASKATDANKKKAKSMIDGSKSVKHLAIGMSNFMLGAGGLHVDAGKK